MRLGWRTAYARVEEPVRAKTSSGGSGSRFLPLTGGTSVQDLIENKIDWLLETNSACDWTDLLKCWLEKLLYFYIYLAQSNVARDILISTISDRLKKLNDLRNPLAKQETSEVRSIVDLSSTYRRKTWVERRSIETWESTGDIPSNRMSKIEIGKRREREKEFPWEEKTFLSEI